MILYYILIHALILYPGINSPKPDPSLKKESFKSIWSSADKRNCINSSNQEQQLQSKILPCAGWF